MSRSIDQAAQTAFAELSGDRNPIHVDEAYAVRSMFGKPLVHGIHLALKALDFFAASSGPLFVTRLEVKFENSLGVGEAFDLEMAESAPGSAVIEARNAARALLARVSFDFRSGREPEAAPAEADFAARPQEHERYEDLAGEETLGYDRARLADLLPAAGEKLSSLNVALLLASTRIVGMKCPGLNSIYHQLALDFTAFNPAATSLAYRAARLHQALGLLTVELANAGGGPCGRLKAFIRPTAPRQKGLAELKEMVEENRFAGQRALVVGGSRGIGAQCAKMLALGGAEVLLTYRRSRREADELAAECLGVGLAAQCVRFDAAAPGPESLERIKAFRPTHLYYFATPHITNSLPALSRDKFGALAETYVFALNDLIGAVGPENLRGVFYPSSTAVEELPNGMIEYALAKYAAELYSQYLRRKFKLPVYNPRFPRIETEQTVNLLGLRAAAPEDVLREELRKFARVEKE